MAASPGLDWDNGEEPLFADDLNSGDNEDPPPLPPPMPPLSQLSQHHHSRSTHIGAGGGGGRGGSGDGEDWDVTGGATAAGGEQTGDDQTTPTQKKRAPILTLTTDRIFSDKGLPYLEKEFPKLKFKGRGHEASDLKYLLQQYEHWANTLYPKLTFRDVTNRIEKLATKKEFKTQVIQMRRRWTRGPTPPIQDDEEDDITTHGHHGDSSSDQHRHSNSPTHQQSGDESTSSNRGPEMLKSRQKTDSESENENDTHAQRVEKNSRIDSHYGSQSGDIAREKRGGSGDGDVDLDDLLMGEDDIVRERERSRKRQRDSGSSSQEEDVSGPAAARASSWEAGSSGVRSKEKWPRGGVREGEDKGIEDLLAEEEQLLMEASRSASDIPDGFDI